MPIHEGMLSITYAWAIGLEIAVGATARVTMLVVDYRQTPIYPDGQFTHLLAGFIAATLGVVAILALLEKDYMAFTFLALAVQYLRDIRKMEQGSLSSLEFFGYARCGNAYIDGISKTYEARNYISMISSMVASSVVPLMESLPRALVVITTVALGMPSVFLLKRFTCRKRVGDICVIQQRKIQIQGFNLFADDAYATGAAGSSVVRELFLQQGLGVAITPKKEQFRATLENVGQWQVILYEATSTPGVKTYQYVKRSVEQGKTVIALVPVDRDTGRMMATT